MFDGIRDLPLVQSLDQMPWCLLLMCLGRWCYWLDSNCKMSVGKVCQCWLMLSRIWLKFLIWRRYCFEPSRLGISSKYHPTMYMQSDQSLTVTNQCMRYWSWEFCQIKAWCLKGNHLRFWERPWWMIWKEL